MHLILYARELTWEVIAWLRSVTKLKIVIKGVMTPEDAATAAWEHGVDGVWVSNHGARQVDTAPATIEVTIVSLLDYNTLILFNCYIMYLMFLHTIQVLPSIVSAVEGSGVEVYIDGGISRGTDVFKVLDAAVPFIYFRVEI